MAKLNWQYELEDMVDAEFPKLGYGKFGRNFSYEITPEILGVIQFKFQRLFAQSGTQLTVDFGVVHWQLSDLAIQMEPPPEQIWTLDYDLVRGVTKGVIILRKSDDAEERREIVRGLMRDVDTVAVPSIRARFNTLQSIAEHLKKYKKWRYHIAEAMSGHGTTTDEQLRSYLPGHPDFGKTISENFKKWEEQDFPVPDLADSKAKLLAKAAHWVEALSKWPRNQRPEGNW